MPRDIMSEQQINIEFVKAVQKHPALYNFELPSYSRKDVSDKAWEEVGNATNMTPSACRERWRNLRAVFMRTMKAAKKSTGKKKPYYLADVMQFVVPFMRPLVEISKDKQKSIQVKEEIKPKDQIEPEQILIEVGKIKVEKLDDNDSDDWSSTHSIEEDKLMRKRAAPEVAEHYPNKKAAPTVQASSSAVGADCDHVKSFLNSLISELNEMNSAQFKNFKRRVLVLIDNITTEIPSSTRNTDDEYII